MKLVFAVFLCSITVVQNFFQAENKVPGGESSLHLQLMDSTLCNGFAFPVGDANGTGVYTAPDGKKYNGWSIAPQVSMQPGRCWNGKGGKDTDLGQAVNAVAGGKVIFAGEEPSGDGRTVLLEHRLAENGKVIQRYSYYAYLDEVKVKTGEQVARGQQLGTLGKANDARAESQLYLEIRKTKDRPDTMDMVDKQAVKQWQKENFEEPLAFIQSHRHVAVPYYASKLVLIDKSKFQCYLYERGNLLRTYEIALGQVPVGAKEKQGDLKVPEGEYRICEKSKGPFSTEHNWSAAYLGTRWLCLTYPNAFDAARALGKKMITQEQYTRIVQAEKAGVKPPQNTPLGGGVGLHGWIESDWSNDSDRAQTWGCVSFHNSDLNEFYELVGLKTTVIIVP